MRRKSSPQAELLGKIEQRLESHTEAEDRRNTKVDAILDKVDAHLGSIDVTLTKQHASLEEHMRRSDALEKLVSPAVKAHAQLEGFLKYAGPVGKLLLAFGLATGGTAGLVKLLEVLFS
jgi:hypothetical protein